MNKLLLVRHGEAIGNYLGVIQGKSNYGLTERGMANVERLVLENRDKFNGYEKIVCSPLIRARETAEIIAKQMNLEVSSDVLLEEFNAGMLEGLRKDFVKRMYPDYYKVWTDRGDLDKIPWAETGDELQARVLMYLEKYLDSDRHEIVVSHAGFLRSMMNTIYCRDRKTSVNLDHDQIYELSDVWKNISLEEYCNAKNSRVFKIETFDKKYIMKKIDRKYYEGAQKEKKILDYLASEINIPKIIGISSRDGYALKMMNYASGVNVYGDINKEKRDNTTIALYKLKQLLKEYPQASDYPVSNILEEVKDILNEIDDEEVREIIYQTFINDRFTKAISDDEIQLVHDDLHRDNILYKDDMPYFLDFDGIRQCAGGYQLGSYIAANYLLYDNDFNIDLVLDKWPEKIDREYLRALVLFRLVCGFNYFDKRVKSIGCSDDDQEFVKKYKRSLVKVSKWGI